MSGSWNPNEHTLAAIHEYITSLVYRLPYLIGIDELLNDCEVIDTDPEAVGAGTFPRYVTVTIKQYHQMVLYRGAPEINVGDIVTVAHFRQGDLYEIIGSGGATGSAVTPLPLLGSYARGRIIRGGATAWEAHDASGDGFAIAGDGTDVASTANPTWRGWHTWLAGGVQLLRDAQTAVFGAGSDMTIGYNGTVGRIRTGIVAPSDLDIDCGAARTLELQTSVWGTCRVSIWDMEQGAVPPSTVAYKSSRVLAFHWNQDQIVYFAVELPHKLKQGTNVDFHVHVTVPDNNAGDVRWVLSTSFADVGGVFPAATWSAGQQTIAVNSLDTHLYYQVSANIANSSGVEGVILCSLQRQGTHALDTYGNFAYLLSAGFHYEIDTIGSRQITTK